MSQNETSCNPDDIDCNENDQGTKIHTRRNYYGAVKRSTVAWAVVLTIAIGGTIVNLGYSYFINEKPVRNAREYLYAAQELNDFEDIKEKLEQCKDIMKDYSDNADWTIFATIDTSFDVFNEVLDSNIETSQEIIDTLNKTDVSYQNALDNFQDVTLPAMAERLGWIMSWMLWRPIHVIIQLLVLLPLVIAVIWWWRTNS
jgi:hypothetical protein